MSIWLIIIYICIFCGIAGCCKKSKRLCCIIINSIVYLCVISYIKLHKQQWRNQIAYTRWYSPHLYNNNNVGRKKAWRSHEKENTRTQRSGNWRDSVYTLWVGRTAKGAEPSIIWGHIRVIYGSYAIKFKDFFTFLHK